MHFFHAAMTQPWCVSSTLDPPLPLAWRLRVVTTVALLSPLLHVVPLHRVANRLGLSRARTSAAPTALAREVDRWLTRLPPPWRSTCLKRAGALFSLLRGAGHDVSLCIGVRRNPGGALAAHAWLVMDNAPILEPDPDSPATFREIARFPESRPTT